MSNNNSSSSIEISIPENTDLNNLNKNVKDENKSGKITDNLKRILALQEKIKMAKEKPVIFSDPIVKQLGKAVIFPNTINAIQGQNGSHKSRLAETICSALLKTPSSKCDLLGFKANDFKSFTVCYVDTERNLKDQLPYALQSIQTKAGYSIAEHPRNFDYISLIEVKRGERLKVLKEYLEYIRHIYTNHIFIVLDVVTDCLEDFNSTKNSLELIDEINSCINTFDVTFLCLIHENPGQGEKARGHIGTEIWNKSSTALQVSFIKDSSNENTDLIRVKYIKCRSTRKHEPFYVKYSEEEKGLILADESEVRNILSDKKTKGSEAEILEYLESYFSEEEVLKKSEIEKKLSNEFHCSVRTIRTRLNEIMKGQVKISNNNSVPCYLSDKLEGKTKVIFLKPINPLK